MHAENLIVLLLYLTLVSLMLRPGWVPTASVTSFQLTQIKAGSSKRLPFQHSCTGHLENSAKLQMEWFTSGCWITCVKSIVLYFIPFSIQTALLFCAFLAVPFPLHLLEQSLVKALTSQFLALIVHFFCLHQALFCSSSWCGSQICTLLSHGNLEAHLARDQPLLYWLLRFFSFFLLLWFTTVSPHCFWLKPALTKYS